MTHQENYNSVSYWIRELQTNVEENIVILVCGNKIDLKAKRVVQFQAASALATETRDNRETVGSGNKIGTPEGGGAFGPGFEGVLLRSKTSPHIGQICVIERDASGVEILSSHLVRVYSIKIEIVLN
jgi:GTPase SAR1 family protein